MCEMSGRGVPSENGCYSRKNDFSLWHAMSLTDSGCVDEALNSTQAGIGHGSKDGVSRCELSVVCASRVRPGTAHSPRSGWWPIFCGPLSWTFYRR